MPGTVNILNELYLMSNLPGALYTPDEQCQLINGPFSSYAPCSVSLNLKLKLIELSINLIFVRE